MFKIFKYPYVYAVGFNNGKTVVYRKRFFEDCSGVSYGFIPGLLLCVFLTFSVFGKVNSMFNGSTLAAWLGFIGGAVIGLLTLFNCVKYISYKYNQFHNCSPIVCYYDLDDNTKSIIAAMTRDVKTNRNDLRVLSYKDSMKFSKILDELYKSPTDKLFDNLADESLYNKAKVK